MNTDTKRHIDAARQVLVGVVPNPTSQIDQITYALIYKFMDDMDQSAIKAGDEPSFFTGDLEPYSWARLMDSKIGNQERLNLYVIAFQKFAEAKQLPELFRNILKSAFLPYRSPETLGLFLKEIEYFDYSHPEELGNAYEYLLSIMGSQGDAGQFRTPRHIIDFIVKVVNPTTDDRVLDPACGTGGFLVSSYRHILEQHDGKNDSEKKERPLTPDQRKALIENFEGYDIDPAMVRIAQVNMYLHQFKNPKIFQYDSLSSEERWGDKFDVIMANPPFMSPKGGIKPHSKFSIQSSRSEVLFVDYIMNHLRPKGRAGVIVPEGIIFQSGIAYKQLRKNLIDDGLYAVVSLPSGVFQPYSGVKTSILLFNNELAKTSKEILFVKVSSDGFDLGAQRRTINKNDLPEAIEVLNKWKVGEKVESNLVTYTEKIKIAENGYNLSGDGYGVAIDYSNVKWPIVELGQICDILDSKRKPITKSDRESGEYPYYGATGVLDYVKDYIFNEKLVLIGEDGAKWGVGEKTAFIAKGRYWVNNHAHVIRPDRTKILDELLVEIINNMDLNPYITGVTVPKLNQEKLRSIKIPTPPLEIQVQIVEELNNYQNIITGAKQIVANWKPKIDIDPKWNRVTLESIADLIQRGKSPVYGDSKTQVIKSGQARGYFEFDFSTKYFVTKEFPLDHRKLQMGDLLINSTGVGTAGRITQYSLTGDFLVDGHITIVRIKGNIAEPKYVLYALDSVYGFKGLENMAEGNGGQIELGLSKIKNLKIPLPPVEIQKQIVQKTEAERELVKSTRKLIDIYEAKTKAAVAKLWGD